MSKKTGEKLSRSEQKNTLTVNLNFAASEAYKLLRTNILFSLPDEQRCRIIGVTSSLRGEGKSTTSINLAYSLAEVGKKVLLIDADMRLPSVAKKMDIANDIGLSNILVTAGESTGVFINKTNDHENLSVITSGAIPPNPSELLSSNRMKKLIEVLSSKFDFIVIDLPPVNIVTDALVISPLLDGMVVVVQENSTGRRSLNECVRLLEMSEAKVLGFVMTRVKDDSGSYRRYKKYGYYGNKYYKQVED